MTTAIRCSLVGTLLLVGCGEDEPCGGGQPTTYRATFSATWSASTHSEGFPDDPHFSRLIGGSHNSAVTFWREGGMATPGIEQMAETGGTGDLGDEVEAAVEAGNACLKVQGGGVNPSPGSTSVEFPIDVNHPLVTLTTMVAPSPDWFVGVNGLDLRDTDGSWVSTQTVDLYVYDAGTDDGSEFTSADKDTQPRQPIARLSGGVFDTPFGTLTFEQL